MVFLACALVWFGLEGLIDWLLSELARFVG